MAEVLEYKCPSCGGGIHFDSATQKMKCPFCEAEFEAEALRQFNAVTETRPPEEAAWDVTETPWTGEGLRGYHCPSCSGEIVGDATTAATRCPFCGNPAVLPSQLRGMYRPDYVLPFKLDKQAAVKAFGENLKGKKLLPKKFRSDSTLEEITGVYVPFWLFDCDTYADALYRATQVHTWSDKHYNYTRTDTYQLRRAGEAMFSGVPCDGSKKMDDAYMEALEPYDYKDLRPFEMTWLSGYMADKYDVTAQENQGRMSARVSNSMDQALMGTAVGYGGCTRESGNLWFRQLRARQALLPVWTLNAKYKDKLYRFAMNGQTGKFVGELPVDKGLSAAWFFGIFGGISALAVILAMLIGGGV